MLTDAVTAQLRAYISEKSKEWATQYIATRRGVLARRKFQHTGDLADSLASSVTEVFGGALTNTVEIGFMDYGRWIDMKGLAPAEGGGQYIEDLAKWVVDKGLYPKLLAGYLERRGLQQAGKSALNDIAWSIARTRATRAPKRRAWYAKSSAGAVGDLFNIIAADMPTEVLSALKKQF